MIPMNSIKLANTSPSLEDVNQTCHICYDSSDGLHFAVYTCRACAAFFRRTVSLKLQYNCRAEGKCAIEKSARNMCRSCRFAKCLNMGMKVTAVQKARDGIGKRKEYGQKSLVVKRPCTIDPIQPSSSEGTPYYPKSELLNGQFAFTSMQQNQFPSAFNVVKDPFQPMRLLTKMHEGYLHFLTIRKATHSLVDNENLTQRFQKNDGLRWPLVSELRPSNFDSSKKVCQLEAHLVTDIVNTYFYPFNELQFTEKVTLFKNFFCYLSHTDWAYQSYKLFGHDENNDRLLMPDGGFIKCSELEKFYANAEGVHSPPEEAARIFRPAMDFILNVIIAHMRRINLTELEYIAILGFFLWNEAVMGISRDTINLIHNTQEIILSDLHTHYHQLGLEGSQITRKAGQLMLLLPKLTRSVVMLRENSELAELFNIFEADVCCKSFKGET